jgi:Outer membrane protein beta-barrel domain
MDFEKEWRDKMLYANVAPNELVWDGIALHLSQKRKKSHKKRWIIWWAAAMLPLFLGDGHLISFFRGYSIPTPLEKTENITKTKISSDYIKIPTQPKTIISNKVSNYQKYQPKFTASADYELESQKILSKKQIEDKPLEALGKPKQRRFWMQTYSSIEQNFTKLNFYSLAPASSRSPFDNPAIVLADKRVKDELASYTPLMSWRLGIDGGYQINRHWYISAGIHFTRNIASMSVDGNSKYPEIAKFYGKIPVMPAPIPVAIALTTPNVETIVTESQNMLTPTNLVTLSPLEPEPNRFIQKTDYISLPIKIGYQVQKNHFRYAVAIGAEGSYLLNNSFISKNESINQVVEHLNRYQVSALAEVSMGISISNKMLLHISPHFRKSLISPFAINSPLQQTQNFTVGLSSGIQYRF